VVLLNGTQSKSLSKDSLPKKGLFPMKVIITTGPDPAPFTHDEGGPLSSSLGLNAIPKLMLNCISCVRELKKIHCLEMEAGANVPFVH
jgi:hypothetical protein